MTTPISVIVPVHNGEQYLAEALTSVFEQTHRPDEIIVVDDGSTDRSAEIAKKFARVRYVYQSHSGQARALNSGVALASGDFLAFLDADDRWLSSKLSRQLDTFLRRPELAIVFGHAKQMVEPGVRLTRTPRVTVLPARLPSAMLLRRDAYRRVGPFSSQWVIGGVIEWCARADRLGLRWAMLDDVVYERRIHGKNLSLRHPDAACDYAKVLKHLLELRRRDDDAQCEPVHRSEEGHES